MNKRIMAIDYGDARIGLAVSDLTGTICGDAWTMEEWNMERAATRIAEEASARDEPSQKACSWNDSSFDLRMIGRWIGIVPRGLSRAKPVYARPVRKQRVGRFFMANAKQSVGFSSVSDEA